MLGLPMSFFGLQWFISRFSRPGQDIGESGIPLWLLPIVLAVAVVTTVAFENLHSGFGGAPWG